MRLLPLRIKHRCFDDIGVGTIVTNYLCRNPTKGDVAVGIAIYDHCPRSNCNVVADNNVANDFRSTSNKAVIAYDGGLITSICGTYGHALMYSAVGSDLSIWIDSETTVMRNAKSWTEDIGINSEPKPHTEPLEPQLRKTSEYSIY